MSDIVNEALAGMAKTGAPRKPMGNPPVQARNASGEAAHGTKVPRKGGQAGDPTAMGTKKDRANVPAERLGAHYGISARVAPAVCPEASATMASGRMLPPTTVRGGFQQSSGGY